MEGALLTMPILHGQLSSVNRISGSLSLTGALTGALSIPTYIDVEKYDGEYEVSPAFEDCTLETKNKTLTDDILVKAIEVQTVSNLSGGKTVYIGGII